MYGLLNCMVPYSTVPYNSIIYRLVSCRTNQYTIELYGAVLYGTIHFVPYGTTLNFSNLGSTVPYRYRTVRCGLSELRNTVRYRTVPITFF